MQRKIIIDDQELKLTPDALIKLSYKERNEAIKIFTLEVLKIFIKRLESHKATLEKNKMSFMNMFTINLVKAHVYDIICRDTIETRIGDHTYKYEGPAYSYAAVTFNITSPSADAEMLAIEETLEQLESRCSALEKENSVLMKIPSEELEKALEKKEAHSSDDPSLFLSGESSTARMIDQIRNKMLRANNEIERLKTQCNAANEKIHTLQTSAEMSELAFTRAVKNGIDEKVMHPRDRITRGELVNDINIHASRFSANKTISSLQMLLDASKEESFTFEQVKSCISENIEDFERPPTTSRTCIEKTLGLFFKPKSEVRLAAPAPMNSLK